MSAWSRRKLVTTGLEGVAGATGLAAAARLAERYGLIAPDGRGLYGPGHTLTYASQRLLTSDSMAREFSRGQISKAPFANGAPPQDDAFKRAEAAGFPDWRLRVEGMVARPTTFSLAELRSFPPSRQITHLACEEGWSFIAEWIGVPLLRVLKLAGIQQTARYVLYFSVQGDWWDSVDMADALHPQTLLTYGMNSRDLPVPHGGPLRVRVPRQLGYKSVKYVNRLLVTDTLKGYLSQSDYSWYAGI